jgi:hypothetical protein
MAMEVPRLRPAWWLVMVGLSAMLSLNYVLPLLNTPVAEYTPFHTHLLIGGSAAGRAWLLTHHQHGLSNVPPMPPTAAAPSDVPTLTSGAAAGDLLSVGAGAGALLADFAWPAAQLPGLVWALLLPAALLLTGRTLTPPYRPPRPA